MKKHAESLPREEAKIGECRINPPVRSALDEDGFPSSKPEQWCGEYRSL